LRRCISIISLLLYALPSYQHHPLTSYQLAQDPSQTQLLLDLLTSLMKILLYAAPPSSSPITMTTVPQVTTSHGHEALYLPVIFSASDVIETLLVRFPEIIRDPFASIGSYYIQYAALPKVRRLVYYI
jgi:hypothetical protein